MAHCRILRIKYSAEETEALISEHCESLPQLSEREIIDLFIGMGFVGLHGLKIEEFYPFLALVRTMSGAKT